MACKECGEDKRIIAKGLCSNCYGRQHTKKNSAECWGCEEVRPIKCKGLCQKCYARFRRHGDVTRERKKKGDTLCTYCGEKPMHAKGYCKGCYQRYRQTGSAEYKRIIRVCKAAKCNEPVVSRGYCEEHKDRGVDPYEAKDYYLKRTFNITIEDYEEMLKNQNDVCAICGQIETRLYNGKKIDLAVDHCHDTGKVRGLLCNKCNIALGGFKDSKDLLTKAINYLK